jgi:hypothetical protein
MNSSVTSLVGVTGQRSNHPAAADALLKLAATLDA